jgi:hypothetical protein
MSRAWRGHGVRRAMYPPDRRNGGRGPGTPISDAQGQPVYVRLLSAGPYRRLRAEILERDGWRCTLRIEGVCKVKADCVHHTLGRGVTGDDPRYMVAACTDCNLNVGDPRSLNPAPTPSTNWKRKAT